MVQSPEHPNPTLEEAFIELLIRFGEQEGVETNPNTLLNDEKRSEEKTK